MNKNETEIKILTQFMNKNETELKILTQFMKKMKQSVQS